MGLRSLVVVPRGWKASASLFTCLCFTVLAVNFSALIWAVTTTTTTTDGGLILRKGANAQQCAAIQDLDTWGHLVINMLSTLLLSGSNFCMQCLSAPTRADINAAHLAGRWLDVGVPSLHNLRSIPGKRLVLWLALGVSSLPLHLFFNSAIFTATTANNYAVFSVDEAFLQSTTATASLDGFNYADAGFMLRSGFDASRLSIPITTFANLSIQLRDAARRGDLDNLTATDCIRAYTKGFQSLYRNVLLVSDPVSGFDYEARDGLFWTDNVNYLNYDNATDVVPFVYARFYSDFTCGGSQPFDWVCSDNGTATGVCDRVCDDPAVLSQALSNKTWTPFGADVSYCLAEPSEEQCSLQFSVSIAILVIVLNLVKLTVMALTVVFAFDKDDPPLLTMGDAVASFLDKPDDTSQAMCLVPASRVKKLGTRLWHRDSAKRIVEYPGNLYPSWSRAVSPRRWVVCLLLYIAALATATGYLSTGLRAMVGSKTLSSLWSIGFGSPSGRTLITSSASESGTSSLIANVVLANTPQLILSLLYFTYNGLFTCMLLAHEWTSYSLSRKSLRVSSSRPQGTQRSGYFLQLPFRFGLPLVLFSLMLHWLVSQSLFVVNVTMTDYTGAEVTQAPNYIRHLVTCGYSPIAILFAIVLGSLLVLALLTFGLGMKLKTGMPIAGSCSLAIAAACHPHNNTSASPPADSSTSEAEKIPVKITSHEPLMWGEVESFWDNRLPPTTATTTTPRLSKRPIHKPAVSKATHLEDDDFSDNSTILHGQGKRQHAHQHQHGVDASEENYIYGPISTKRSKHTATNNNGSSSSSSDNSSSSTLLLSSTDQDSLGHCAFSAGPVTMPIKGRLYA
ncbi:uncharacterized protein PV07_07697 [Cladophialophora immunda]|uniref:DUF6536 domain-containing protein n=1 Tax=Cladophialophora immunda TaxID=569365 RepID=A0A0D2CCH4_9EURO|nr:uncharacterized protein PV07_07697 [Cladophialophora immunda]KIW28005.1 hypothetical protein PV07_07697 [Cladophialophora immunda]